MNRQDFRTAVKGTLQGLRDSAREEVLTTADHFYEHHRADEFLRDLLEEVLHE